MKSHFDVPLSPSHSHPPLRDPSKPDGAVVVLPKLGELVGQGVDDHFRLPPS